MIQQDIKVFRGSGLNKDDNVELIQGADAQNRSNLGFINGNYDTLLPRREVASTFNPPLPSGTNTTIGYCEDIENQAFIAFIHNSNNQHCILRGFRDYSYEFISSGSSAWAFSTSNPIYNPRIVGTGTDATLVWTDNLNAPRSINISYFVASPATTPDEGNSFLHKPAPIRRPAVTIGTDSAITTNNIRGKVFQFAYAYVYGNGQISKPSHFSDINYAMQDTFAHGGYVLNPATHNKITLSMPVDYTYVSKLEIYFRLIDVGSGAPGFWQRYDVIDVTSTTMTYTFYNDRNGVSVDENDFLVNYDDVPKLSRALEVINKNRVCLGGNTYKYGLTTPNVTLSAQNSATSMFFAIEQLIAQSGTAISGSYVDIDFDYLYTAIGYTGEMSVELVIVRYTGILGDTYDSHEVYTLKSDLNISTVTTTKDLSPLVDYFDDRITAETSLTITITQPSANVLRITNGYGGLDKIGVLYQAGSPIAPVRSLKTDSKQTFLMAYYDSFNKDGRCEVTDSLYLYVPYLNHRPNIYFPVAKYSINHQPPVWAKCYQFLWGGSSVQNHFTVPVLLKNQTGETADITDNKETLSINLTAASNRVANNSRYLLPTFTPEKGDFVRVMSYVESNVQSITEPSGENIYLPVLDYNSSTGVVTTPSIANYDFYNNIVIGNDQVLFGNFQFIRPSINVDSEDVIYYEVGDVIPISNPGTSNRMHQATSHISGVTATTQTNYTGTGPAVGVINFGDVFIRPISLFPCYYDTLPAAVGSSDMHAMWIYGHYESNSVSYQYNSYPRIIGRAHAYDGNETQVYENSIHYGGILSNGSLVFNELNRFSSSSKKYIQNRNGYIRGLIESGYTLYSFQDTKVTPIEIGRQTVEQDGQYMVVSTNVVLGSDRPFRENFGTLYPGSITQHAGYIWFYDSINMTVYQIAQNGLEDIGARKMKSYFVGLADSIPSDSANYDFTSLYDYKTECYVLICRNKSTPANSWSLSYSPVLSKWQCFENYKSEGGLSITDKFVVSFSAGIPYSHHTFFEGSELGYTDVHFNDPKLVHKLFKGIEVDSNYIASSIPSIWVGRTKNFPIFQDNESNVYYSDYKLSFIPDHLWKKGNGSFNAPFLRNIVLNDFTTTSTSLLYTGERLAGNYITIRLTNPLGASPLRFVKLKYITKR